MEQWYSFFWMQGATPISETETVSTLSWPRQSLEMRLGRRNFSRRVPTQPLRTSMGTHLSLRLATGEKKVTLRCVSSCDKPWQKDNSTQLLKNPHSTQCRG